MEFSDKDVEPFTEFEKSGWERAADAYHDQWGGLTIQSSSALLEAANVQEGSRVLDIATGAGYVAAKAAKIGAIATGLDFSEAQIALARETYGDVNFLQGDAHSLPFDGESFDAVVMGFGMNHLPKPETAVAEAWRVLKPEGAFAFTVWAKPEPGEAFGIVLSALADHGVSNDKLPPAPPYFRFADAEEVCSVLTSAGFSDIRTELVPQIWHHSTPDLVFDAFNEGAVRATAMLQSQPEDVREIIRDVVRLEVERLKEGHIYRVPAPAALSVGLKRP